MRINGFTSYMFGKKNSPTNSLKIIHQFDLYYVVVAPKNEEEVNKVSKRD